MNQTPGGFFSIVKGKKTKYTEERSDYVLESGPHSKSKGHLRSFGERTDRSMATLDGGPK